MTSRIDLDNTYNNIWERTSYIKKYMELSCINFEKTDTISNYTLKIRRNIENINNFMTLASKSIYLHGCYHNNYMSDDENQIILIAIQSHHKIVEETYHKLIQALSEEDAKLLFDVENSDLSSRMNECQDKLIKATLAKLSSEKLWEKYQNKN